MPVPFLEVPFHLSVSSVCGHFHIATQFVVSVPRNRCVCALQKLVYIVLRATPVAPTLDAAGSVKAAQPPCLLNVGASYCGASFESLIANNVIRNVIRIGDLITLRQFARRSHDEPARLEKPRIASPIG